jgi:hypothetical protein
MGGYETRLRRAFVAADFISFLKRKARARQRVAAAAVRQSAWFLDIARMPDCEPWPSAPRFANSR